MAQPQNTDSRREEGVTLQSQQEVSESLSQTEQKLEDHRLEVKEEGNFKVVTDLGKVIEGLSLSTFSYVSITCDTQGIEGDDEGLPEEWTALFPRSFFVEGGGQIISGHKLTIKTETDSPEEDDGGEEVYRTIFQSDSFSLSSGKRITGRWNYGEDEHDGKLIDPVRVVVPATEEKIYFVRADSDDEK